MIDWLRRAGMLRPRIEPEMELIGELFRVAAPRFACPDCGAMGLFVRAPREEDDEEWGMARQCEICKRPIARERLEALPDTRLCIDCQARSDRGKDSAAAEYCPRCGTPMVVRPTRGAGITRYQLTCPACRG
jgi:hypothetical protein